MDVLSVVFFLVAGIWLLAALLYSIMVLCILRMRNRDELGSVHDENFCRVQLCRTGYYLPLGCFFRRYARHFNLDDERPTTRPCTRQERRAAIEALLMSRNVTFVLWRSKSKVVKEEENSVVESPTTNEAVPDPEIESIDLEAGNVDDDQESEDGGAICSICLVGYENSAAVFSPKTCSHQFHEGCILNWLQRPANLECPCCRSPMVTDDQVWNMVKRLRKEKRKQLHRDQQKSSKVRHDAQQQRPEVSETENEGSELEEA